MTTKLPTYLITGATSGIGYQLTLDYLKDGAVVYAVGRNQEALDELSALGAITLQVNLTQRDQVIQSLSNIESLDCVICCAGVCHYIDIEEKALPFNKGELEGTLVVEKKEPILTFDSETFMQVINSNLATLAYTIEAVLPQLHKSKGRLVALGSASAFVPFERAEAYGSSKAAVHYLTKALQISLKQYDISVSLVIPGFVDSPMTAQNDFDMPFLQTVEQASRAIREGIDKGEDVIEFPKRLTLPLKTLGVLPDGVWQKVASKLYQD